MTDPNNPLENPSLKDPFTGLLGRRGFRQRLTAEYGLAKQMRFPLSLVALDLDRFQEVNLRFYVPGADKVLLAISSVVKSAARPGDVVARDGGDQFSVILTNTGQEEAYREADRLRRAIELATVDLNGTPAKVTASVGVAVATFEEAEPWELFTRARDAVHQAKVEGRNRVSIAQAK